MLRLESGMSGSSLSVWWRSKVTMARSAGMDNIGEWQVGTLALTNVVADSTIYLTGLSGGTPPPPPSTGIIIILR